MNLNRYIRDVGTITAVVAHTVFETVCPPRYSRADLDAAARAAEDALNEFEAENDGLPEPAVRVGAADNPAGVEAKPSPEQPPPAGPPRAQCRWCGDVDTTIHQCRRHCVDPSPTVGAATLTGGEGPDSDSGIPQSPEPGRPNLTQPNPAEMRSWPDWLLMEYTANMLLWPTHATLATELRARAEQSRTNDGEVLLW